MTCENCIHKDLCYENCELNYDRDDLTCYYCKSITCPEHLECKFFKDKSRFIELPCKVGDMIYMHNRNGTRVQEMVLDSPDIRCHCSKDEFSHCMSDCSDRQNGICAYRFNNDFSEISKTVFLTREEAEKALKERKQ